MASDFSELDAKASDLLIRAIATGDAEVLAELALLYRPMILAGLRRDLAGQHLERYAEDLTQDTIIDIIQSFPRTYDPTRSPFHAWVKKIRKNTYSQFLISNRILLNQEDPPDNAIEKDDGECPIDPLDRVAFLAWERDVAEKPISQANKYFVHRFSRAVTKERKRKAKEKEQQSRPGSGNYRRDHRFLTVWELKAIQKKRAAFAERVEPTLNAASEK